MKIRPVVLSIALVSSFSSWGVAAQDDSRLDRMQQTIQELTLQLGDAIRDNAKLRSELSSIRQEGSSAASVTDTTCESEVEVRYVEVVSPRPVAPHKGHNDEVSEYSVEEPVTCPIDQLRGELSGLSDATMKESTIHRWLVSKGETCDRQQLQQLLSIANGLSLSDDATALIDYLMSQAK